MTKVFILVLWATGAGAEVGPVPHDTFSECLVAGQQSLATNKGYEAFGCVELEIVNPE